MSKRNSGETNCGKREPSSQSDRVAASVTASGFFQAPWNLFGLPAESAAPERARAWVLPIPYESTTSYGAGTRDGPAAIIAASRQIELFEREFGCEPAMKVGVHTMRPLVINHRSPADMIQTIAKAVSAILTANLRPELLLVLGGEHTVSVGAAQGLAQAGWNDFVTVQFDAHADLRDEYEGTPYSHACTARRLVELSKVSQIGVRNLSQEEEAFRRRTRRVRTIFVEDIRSSKQYLSELARFVHGKVVYLTIDLDVLDPALMPAVGTPEPDGLSWNALLELLRVVFREADYVPVADVVELAPIPGLRAPDFLVAKLVHMLVALALVQKERGADRSRGQFARRKAVPGGGI
ncbi:MAG: agmatinase [Kiritimatiellia bacterium]